LHLINKAGYVRIT